MPKNKKNSFRELTVDDIECPKSQQDFATDVLVGLSLSPKRLPCKYIYDDRGSRLFQKIMALPEYYLTSSESEILKEKGENIVQLLGNKSLRLVELGAGDGAKTRFLLEQLMAQKVDFLFNPIDISKSAIKDLTGTLEKQIPELKIEGLVSDYFRGLKWLSSLGQRVNVVLFLGSNIGNFEPRDADVFLSNLWNACNNGDYLLIGFDLKKDLRVLLKAYNDSRGVTARFIKNILLRINNELGGHFNVNQFEYFSTYDVLNQAIKSYLISQRDQTVCIDLLNRGFEFAGWEPVHVESSYKYDEKDIRHLARKNGFVVMGNFYDAKRYFILSLWRVEKEPLP